MKISVPWNVGVSIGSHRRNTTIPWPGDAVDGVVRVRWYHRRSRGRYPTASNTRESPCVAWRIRCVVISGKVVGIIRDSMEGIECFQSHSYSYRYFDGYRYRCLYRYFEDQWYEWKCSFSFSLPFSCCRSILLILILIRIPVMVNDCGKIRNIPVDTHSSIVLNRSWYYRGTTVDTTEDPHRCCWRGCYCDSGRSHSKRRAAMALFVSSFCWNNNVDPYSITRVCACLCASSWNCPFLWWSLLRFENGVTFAFRCALICASNEVISTTYVRQRFRPVLVFSVSGTGTTSS